MSIFSKKDDEEESGTQVVPFIREGEEVWIKTYWRPAIAWQYFVVCVFDFLLAPLMTAWYSWFVKIPYVVWKPITLGEGGFYHMAMGAIIGVAAWTRGREKVARIESDIVLSSNFQSETQKRIAAAKTKSNIKKTEE